jgi:hypothetical protein
VLLVLQPLLLARRYVSSVLLVASPHLLLLLFAMSVHRVLSHQQRVLLHVLHVLDLPILLLVLQHVKCVQPIKLQIVITLDV